jgi:hypothetical protein
MTTTTHSTPDISTLSKAIQDRDADGVLSWYHKDAVLTIHDREHPPTAPLTLTGAAEIGGYYRDVCGRNIEHEVRDAIITDRGLAYTQYCSYPDGAAVICVTVANLHDGKIDSQTAIQVWD